MRFGKPTMDVSMLVPLLLMLLGFTLYFLAILLLRLRGEVLAIVGVVNVPIIHYSVEWWNSLHQAPSVMRFGKPTMDVSMLVPLLLMLLGFTLYFLAILLLRLRGEVLRRERSASWLREALQS